MYNAQSSRGPDPGRGRFGAPSELFGARGGMARKRHKRFLPINSFSFLVNNHFVTEHPQIST
jgi:hypothetical protein